MGNIFGSCKRNRISSRREITLLMIGLDNAGKTCTAKHLLGESTVDVVPTVGFSSVQMKCGKYSVTVYDLGGGSKIRGIWKSYYALVHGLIFVVDASDPQRLQECKGEMANVLKDDRIAGKPMLLLVNKQDMEGAVNEMELVHMLDLEAMVNEQQCPTRVEASCALYNNNDKSRDRGIQEGFKWLIGHITNDFRKLNERVQREMTTQKEAEEKERAERMERVRKLREERERLEAEQGSSKNNEEQDDGDSDVIIGNPFKPVSIIRDELESRSKKEKEHDFLQPGTKIIHVSPSGSHSKDEEIIHVRSQGTSAVLKDSPAFASSSFSPDSNSKTVSNGIPKSSALPPLSHSITAWDEKKKTKKHKKRFKNRVMPEVTEGYKSYSAPGRTELPPLRTSGDGASSGHPVGYLSPYRSPIRNGKINWMLAEELIPIEDKISSKSEGAI